MKNLELRSRKDNEIKVKDNNRYSSGKTENYTGSSNHGTDVKKFASCNNWKVLID